MAFETEKSKKSKSTSKRKTATQKREKNEDSAVEQEAKSQQEASIQPPHMSIKELPSGFMAYPDGITINYHPYTFGEVESINSSNMSPADKLRFVASGIEVHGMDVEDITLADYLYLAVLRRLSTLGTPKFNITAFCEACGKIHSQAEPLDPATMQMEEMDVKALPIKAPTIGSLSEVRFYPLTLGDYLHMLDNELDENDDILGLALCAKSHDFQIAYDAFYKCTGRDIALLKTIDRKLHHGLAPMSITCANEECKATIRVELDAWEVVITPFREHGVDEEVGLSYGD